MNIAGILSQKQDVVECFIGCWGRTSNRYKKHYHSMKGELLALGKTWSDPEVLAPLFSLYRCIQPEVHCQHKRLSGIGFTSLGTCLVLNISSKCIYPGTTCLLSKLTRKPPSTATGRILGSYLTSY